MIFKTTYKSKIGDIIIVCNDKNLVAILIDGQPGFVNYSNLNNSNHSILTKTKNWLDSYFNGKQPKITDLPICLCGTAFQNEVWKILMTIPYGKTTTYGDIAKTIAKQRGVQKMSAQAVGGAVGSNLISIIIPCHRVIGTGGKLTGYQGGLNLKTQLLSHEGITF